MALIIFTLIIGLLPSFVWLIFFYKEDLHPEPKKLLVLTFLSGLIAAFLSLLIEYGLTKLVNTPAIKNYTILSLLIMAAIEEIVKFFCVFSSINNSPYFDEPTDAMVYLITAALGFATFENLAINFSIISSSSGSFILSEIISATIFRFIGATLLHSLCSAIIGFWWAKGILRYQPKKFIFYGLVIASLLHAFFNYLILSYESIIIYPIIFLSIVTFFVLIDFDKLRRYNQ